MILLYILISISIAFVVITLNCTFRKYVKEEFNDFKVDENQLINENSIRFFTDKPYNDQRGAFAFRNLDYFVKNKNDIFKYYNTDDRIIKFYDENHDKSFDPITDNPLPDASLNAEDFKKTLDKYGYGRNQVGLGFDKETNSSKIYILDKTSIKSLKIVNGKVLKSLYHIVPNFEDKIISNFLGKPITDKINKNLSTIKFYKDDYLNNMQNLDLIIDIFGNQKVEEYKKELAQYSRKKDPEPLSLNILNCYDRYDDNKLLGYHIDVGDYNLKVYKDRKFVINLLKDLELNVNNIDNWINSNKDAQITWISFIKTNNKNSVTIYYRY